MKRSHSTGPGGAESFDTDPEEVPEKEHQVVAGIGQVHIYEGEGVG